jgi:hypothetical protein
MFVVGGAKITKRDLADGMWQQIRCARIYTNPGLRLGPRAAKNYPARNQVDIVARNRSVSYRTDTSCELNGLGLVQTGLTRKSPITGKTTWTFA